MLWQQSQNWSIKNFAFREYICRTLGNCCRLYGKHWETSALINFTKELPQNTTVIQSEHTDQYQKVPMTAPSRGSLWYLRCYKHLWCRFSFMLWRCTAPFDLMKIICSTIHDIIIIWLDNLIDENLIICLTSHDIYKKYDITMESLFNHSSTLSKGRLGILLGFLW